MGFNELKKKSGNIDKLTSELNKITKGSESYKDDRFWRPELDKSSNGYAVIRFLPPVDGEDIPWARLFSHGFQGPGGWFIENVERPATGSGPQFPGKLHALGFATGQGG